MFDLVPIRDGLTGGLWPARILHGAKRTALVNRGTYAAMREQCDRLRAVQDEAAGAWPAQIWVPPHPLALTPEVVADITRRAAWRHTGDTRPSEICDAPPQLTDHAHRAATVLNVNLGRDLTGPASGQLLRYGPGDEFRWHTDHDTRYLPHKTFQISVVALLSDPGSYSGGRLEIETTEGVITTPPQAGTVAVFPSETSHRVTEVTAGHRVSASVFLASNPTRKAAR